LSNSNLDSQLTRKIQTAAPAYFVAEELHSGQAAAVTDDPAMSKQIRDLEEG